MAQGIRAQVPLGRFGKPREVAAVAAFSPTTRPS